MLDAADRVTELRPVRNASPGAAFAALVWLGAAVLFAAGFTGTTRVLLLAASLACGVGTAAGLWVSSRRTRITINGAAVTFAGLWRERPLTGGAVPVARVVEVSARLRLSRRDVRLLLFVDADSRARLNLNPDAWAPHDLRLLYDALRIEPPRTPDAMRLAQLRQTFPGAVPRWLLL